MSVFSSIVEEENAAARLSRETVSAGPILAVDVGSIYTRAVLLDIVDGGYRFIARGESPSTAVDPWKDVLVGVFNAIDQIAAATEREIIDQDGDLILPPEGDFRGVGVFVATASAGKPIRTVLLGLLPGISLESGRRAVESIYADIVKVFSLDDKKTAEEQMDSLLHTDTDLIMVVGGTDGGATELMQRYIDTIALAYSLMDNQARPPILYAGNNALSGVLEMVGEEIGIKVLTAANVRPSLDVEYLDDAQEQLANLYHRQKSQHTAGFTELGNWMESGVYPTAHGFGRLVHLFGSAKGQNVLGIDLGSSSTTVAATINNIHYVNVFGNLGMGHAAKDALSEIPVENLVRWLSFEPENTDLITDYVWNKSLFPQSIPSTIEEIELEYALAREILRHALQSARLSWRNAPQKGLMPHFDSIIFSGATITRAPSNAWGLMVAADGVQPTGMSRIYFDPHSVAAALGAIAPRNPEAVVTALESGAFYDLGYLVSTTGRAAAVRGKLSGEGLGEELPVDAKYGTITSVPLEFGISAELNLRLASYEGYKRKMTVDGGLLGLTFDTRGRPLRLPRNSERRQEQMRQWRKIVSREG